MPSKKTPSEKATGKTKSTETAAEAPSEPYGTTMTAINKFIASTYKVDVVKLAPHINRAIEGLVEKGLLTQTGGSFKLTAADCFNACFEIKHEAGVKVKVEEDAPNNLY